MASLKRRLGPRMLKLLLLASVLLVVWFLKSQQKAAFDQLNTPIVKFSVITKNVVGGPLRPSTATTNYGTNAIQRLVGDIQACRIPTLDKDAPEVMKFFSKAKPLACHKNEKNWAYVDNGAFYISEEAVSVHGSITCNHRQFWRLSENQLNEEMIADVKNGTLLEKTDYFRAECTANGGVEWNNLFANIVPVKSAIERARKAVKSPRWSGLNVYFLGFDSLSRLTFQRKMPKAFRYLTKNLSAVVLQGYNIVGDGTPQAFIPILTAQTEEELPLTRKRYANANYVDIYPMIWRNFSERGYVTLYGEDLAEYGTFTYRLKGFKQQPTDHYFPTFFRRTENELKDRKCLGSEPQHVVWFRYGQQFFDQYPAELAKFALLHHGELSHDDVNMVELADDDFTKHLQLMEAKGYFNNTLLIVMADHGHRFAKLRETHQGQLEERLPFFSIALPKAFREGRGKGAWKNLKVNAERLTMPFDIYSTLADLLDWPTDEQMSVPGQVSQRSLSLWRPVPKERTCADAGIETHWCTCLQWETVDIDGMDVKAMARAVIQVINGETAPERQLCSALRLHKIEEARRMVANPDLLRYKSVKDIDGFVPDLAGNTKLAFATYQLRLRTMPGDALYEVTIQYDIDKKHVTVDLDAISHINPYGDRPHCIIDKNYFLATYCVCYDRI